MSLVTLAATAVAVAASGVTPLPAAAPFNPIPDVFVSLPTASMAPTFPARSLLVVEPLSGALARGDLVRYRSPPPAGAVLAGRIVGLPGDRIRLENSHAIVNDEVSPDYGVPFSSPRIVAGGFPAYTETYVVPPDSYYVLPDDRDGAIGSIDFGAVDRASVSGRLSTWSDVTRRKGRMASIFAAALAPTKKRLPFDAGQGFEARDIEVVDDTTIKVTFGVDDQLLRAMRRNEAALAGGLRDDFCANRLIRLATGMNITYVFAGAAGSGPITIDAEQRACP